MIVLHVLTADIRVQPAPLAALRARSVDTCQMLRTALEYLEWVAPRVMPGSTKIKPVRDPVLIVLLARS